MNVKEYLRTESFIKSRESIISELNLALSQISSVDLELRKKGEKVLSYNSRRELGWKCLPVREWFLDDDNKDKLFDLIEH